MSVIVRYVVVDSMTGDGFHVQKDKRPVYQIKEAGGVYFIARTPGDAIDWAIAEKKRQIRQAIENLEKLNRLKSIYEKVD